MKRIAGHSGKDAETFLATFSPAQQDIVEALRCRVRRAAPKAVESVVCGSLSCHLPEAGGRVKGTTCLITPPVELLVGQEQANSD